MDQFLVQLDSLVIALEQKLLGLRTAEYRLNCSLDAERQWLHVLAKLIRCFIQRHAVFVSQRKMLHTCFTTIFIAFFFADERNSSSIMNFEATVQL